jgi:hypothetical protein
MIRGLLGLIIGYAATTLTDTLYHRYVQHAPRAQIQRWRRTPHIYLPLLRAVYAHRIHHARAALRARRGALLGGRGPNALGAPDVAWLALGALSLVCAAIYFALGMAALLGALLPALLHPWLTAWLHPRLHVSAPEAQAGALARWLLRRRSVRALARYHRHHHEQPRTRFNLLPGADRLLGLHRSGVNHAGGECAANQGADHYRDATDAGAGAEGIRALDLS